ncbi:MAG: cytochrome b [Gammaproteobacteria bacterium]|nr:cytochrome b [Gammaproteobacteria bacterium]
MKNTQRYDSVAILLHWSMFILIATMFGLGWYMVELPQGGSERSFFFALHKSLGLTLALLLFVRIGWRLRHRPPSFPGAMPAWQGRMARAVHFLLYLFMFLQPLSGYLSSSFSGYSTRFWGIPLPDWGWQNSALNESFTEIHVASSVALLCLIILHVCGAFAHLLGVHENLLPRMLPVRLSRVHPGNGSGRLPRALARYFRLPQ